MTLRSTLSQIWNRARTRNKDREEGTTFQSSTTNRYQAPEITAAKIRELEDNAYFVKLEQNRRNLLFAEKVTVRALDPQGDEDEALSETLTGMCNQDAVRLHQKAIMLDSSIWRYGAGLINQVWGWRGSEYRLLALRHLPAWTFAEAPVNQADYLACGDVLRGIVLNRDGEIEFWQKQDADSVPVQVKNVTMITDPVEPALAGVPGCIPAVHIIHMLGYYHDAHLKKANRIAAPPLFPKITEEKPRSSSVGSDAAYLKTVLANWGINTAFALRENMDFADPHLIDSPTALDMVKHLEGLLDRLYSPSSLISKEGTLIGGSNIGEVELLRMFLSTVHRWQEEAWEGILQYYLDVNQYADYTVEVVFPPFEIDQTALNIQKVAALKATTTSKALATRDEQREILGLPPGDEELWQTIEDEAVQPPEPQPNPFMQNPFGQEGGSEFARQAVPVKTPAKVEKTIEQELEEETDTALEEVIAALAKEETGSGEWAQK